MVTSNASLILAVADARILHDKSSEVADSIFVDQRALQSERRRRRVHHLLIQTAA
jgi:hypothetical protein